MKNPKMLLAAALKLVESESIRSWAQSAKNGPIWEQIAAQHVKKGQLAPNVLCTRIVSTAIG